MWDHTEDVTLFIDYTLSLVLRTSTNITKNHTHHRITTLRLHSESCGTGKKKLALMSSPPLASASSLHPSPSLTHPFRVMSLASVSVVLVTSIPHSLTPSMSCLQPPPPWFYESRLLARWSRILPISGSDLGILALIFLFLAGR
jgi:hypothetical protein